MSGQRIRRYGRRLLIITGRLGIPLGFRIDVLALPRRLTLGLWTYSDEDDDGTTLAIGLLLLEVEVHPIRYLTKRALDAKRDEAAARWAPKLIEELEDHLGDQ